MAYLKQRKENGIWEIWWESDTRGKFRHKSTGTRDRGSAEEALAKFILQRPHVKVDSGVTVLWCLLRYWELYAQHIFSKDTVRAVIKAVEESEPETRVVDFSIPKQQEFSANLGVSTSTQRRYMGVIRAALQHLVDRGELETMIPVLKVKAQDGEGARPFEVAELQALCEAAVLDHERMFLLLCLSTAPRPAATLDVTWSRFNGSTRVIDYNVPGRKKTKKRRGIVPVAPSAAAYLEARRGDGTIIKYEYEKKDGTKVSRPMTCYKRMFRRLVKRAGIAGSAYGIRKAASIWLRAEGVPEWDAKGMLAHSIGGETEHYAHYRPDYMRAAADSVERLLRKVSPSWLSSYLPAAAEGSGKVVDFVGGRDRDRTCDPYHVKDGGISQLLDFENMKAANDD